MERVIQPAATSTQPLDSADLELLRDLRRGLRSAVIFHVIVSAPFAFAAVAMGWTTFDLGSRDSRMPGLLLFCLVCAGFFALAVYFGVKNTRLFRYVGNVLRSPEGFHKTVTRGELGGISEHNGLTRYEVGGEFFPVWIPIRHANNGNLQFIKSARHLSGLIYQPVVLERIDLPGAPAPVLLKVDYQGYPPIVTERASTEEECRDVAAWDFSGMLLWIAGLFVVVFTLVLYSVFGPIVSAVFCLVGVAAFLWLRRTIKSWADIKPRTLTVTGVVVEVLDSSVAVGRMSELQRWYRIGDRLYPTGRTTRDDDPITCGSVVKMVYVDRSPRGGRILHIQPIG